MMQNDDNLKKRALGMLSDKRRLHTEGVRKTAKELCEIYGADAGKTDLAVCCHDIYRGRQTEELDELIDRYDIPDRYKGNANLSHGKIAAAVMENEFGISDRQILDAVSYHTTGRAGMSVLEMIVFLAEMLFIPCEDTIYTWQEAITPLRGTLLPRRDTFTSGRCPREPCWAHTSPSWLPGRRPCQIRVPPRRPRTESSHWSQYHTSCRRRQSGCHQRK